MFGTWKCFLERIILIEISISYEEFILHLLLSEATVQSDHRHLGNPVFFLSLSWKLKDNENSVFNGWANIYICGLLIYIQTLKKSNILKLHWFSAGWDDRSGCPVAETVPCSRLWIAYVTWNFVNEEEKRKAAQTYLTLQQTCPMQCNGTDLN